jgi:hypothetical protein
MTPFFFARLADYLHAVAALEIAQDAEKQRGVAELLGLAEPAETIAAIQVVRTTEAVVPPSQPETIPPQGQATVTATTTGTLTSSRQPRQRRRPVTFSIQPLPPRPLERLAWLDAADILEPPRSTSATPAPLLPLFPRRSSRAILTTALASQTETNQIDIHAVLAAEVEGRTLLRIPRRVVPSLSRGVQVILDRGSSSAPFHADQKLLLDQIRAVGGQETVSVVDLDPSEDFRDDGSEGIAREYFDRFRPLPGVVVTLVSDLGIAQVSFERTAPAGEWERFLRRIRAGGNPVVAFVPYGWRRWPAVLRKYATLVQWDRRTTVQAVRRALERSAR